ncbi:MAG: carbohydrate-binding protein, partial [Bacteroidetes bacterium]
YDLRQDSLYVVAQIPVFTGFEDGLLGIAADPHYAENHWIYMIYSPPGTEAKQHVSRFVFENRKLDMDSEKVLLEIRTQRDQCCHSGGSLEFGPDGLLYISTGDDTNPFASNGFAPIDERPGRKPWDAQRSSANTNDLRGKILRIKPEADGTYSIPEGNLFPPGTPNTRPEIYVMGCRNPFRISIDQKTNFLYWGDVGPDAGKDGENRGPKGYDELNQARHAGFWGWPYTRGDNKAYFDYDFATQTSGERFKPEQLINDSPNNTGLKELPPAQKSFIWYSYDRSEEFPWTATGGKNPMAGPVYYSELFEGVKNRFPDYFNGKLFFYEWMRDWIFIITMDENHNFVKAEPFMQHSSFANPMDMVFGKDGNLYLLEYGEKWFSQNLDARLNKIEYVSGNRAPIARITSDVQVGPAPLTVQFSAAASEDFDQEPLTYSWAFTSAKEQSTALSPSFTFEKEGIYKVQLRVKDPSGQQDVATQEIMVGNSPPEVRIELANANPYYWDNRPLNYKVVVEDAEDGSTEAGTIDMERLKVTLTYIPEGEDLVSAALGHQQQSIPKGKTLIEGSDCKACHALDKKVNGPSYQDIAAKYSLTDTAFLVSKIIQGGSGVWGDNMMSAHPQLSRADVHQMVSYILQLNQAPATAHLLPAAGTIRLTDHIGKESTGKYVLLASYRDKGKGDIASLSAQQIVELKYPRLEAEEAAERSEDTNVFTAANSSLLGNLKDGDYFMFDSLLLDQLQAVELRLFFRRNAHYKGKVEVRLDRPDGPLLGHTQWTYQGSSPAQKTYRIPLKSNSGRHRVYFVFRSLGGADQPGANADYVYLKYRTPNL